jgi:hypothetical protein
MQHSSTQSVGYTNTFQSFLAREVSANFIQHAGTGLSSINFLEEMGVGGGGGGKFLIKTVTIVQTQLLLS